MSVRVSTSRPVSSACSGLIYSGVPVNDALVVRVLDGLTQRNEQPQSLLRAQLVLVAVLGDGDTLDVFHREVRPARFRRSRIENTGDVRVIQHRQGLPLRLK